MAGCEIDGYSSGHGGVCETPNEHRFGGTSPPAALPCPWQSPLASMSHALAAGATQQ